jgi:hypothetical protein
MNSEKNEAHRILSMWREGFGESDGITAGLVNWCLSVTGELTGLKQFEGAIQ